MAAALRRKRAGIWRAAQAVEPHIAEIMARIGAMAPKLPVVRVMQAQEQKR